MPRAAGSGRYGEVFNEVAEEYDRHRPAYPDALIDQACEVGGLGPGATVLEIGCGTGQLTRSLLARGLRVTAIEPGGRLMARRAISSPTPGRWSSSSGALRRRRCRTRITRPRFRDRRFTGLIRMSVGARPPTRWLIAVPSRWSPTSDWRQLRSAGDQQALRAAMASVAPGLGADWPTYRDLDGTLGGVDERRGNVSDVWAWLVGYELARGYAADLFDDTQVAAVPTLLEHTADALNALLGTMSFWARLSPRSATLCAPRTRLSTKARPADLLQHRRLPGNGATRSAHLTAVRHLAPGRRTQAITCRHCGNWIAFPVPPPRGGRSPSPRPELRGLSGQTCAFGPARPRPEPWSRRRPRPGCSPISA